MGNSALRPRIIILTDEDARELRLLRQELNDVHRRNWEEYLRTLPDIFDGAWTKRIDELEAINPKLKVMNKRLVRQYGRQVNRYIDEVEQDCESEYVCDITVMLDTLPGIANLTIDFQPMGTMPLPS